MYVCMLRDRALNTIVLAISSQQRRPEYDDSKGEGRADFFPGTSVSRWCLEWTELLTEAIGGIAAAREGKAGAKVSPIGVDTDTHGLYVTFVKTSGSSSSGSPNAAVMMSSGKASNGTQQVDGDYALVRPSLGAVSSGSESSVSEAGAPAEEWVLEERGPDKAGEEYPSNLLDILALAFTAIKLLFLQGQLGALPRLIRHVEWARRASKKPLHETK
jgi:hypothetical protein